ncbi:MsnO8 family LLM class oxidoreductase [Thorsellia kenyensis]|uniref:MsnO8 family LLM class oxidoreductase n=1 Tax=Thorsellia kenyensis TaxID=1549888 RepID=A0ABV6CBB2_9GAMM
MSIQLSDKTILKLSVLDKCPIEEERHAEDALKNTLELAKLADDLGYNRFWIAEHHNSLSLASPSPEIVVAWLASQTKKIRLGSGGVMLQHYSAYKVAENFNLLANLAPGRIDLGIGKAPGGLPQSTQALQRGINPEKKGSFEEQIEELNAYLTLNSSSHFVNLPSIKNTKASESSLKVTPEPKLPADKFLLGASEESATLAGKLKWNFVYAAHLNGDKEKLKKTLIKWQSLSPLPTIVAVQVIIDEKSEQAKKLAQSIEMWGVELDNGQRITVQTKNQALSFAEQAGRTIKRLERRDNTVISGTAQEVYQKLKAMQETYKIDEFIVEIPLASQSVRKKTLKLLAEYVNTALRHLEAEVI